MINIMKEIPVTLNLTPDELSFLVQLLEPISYSKEIQVPQQYDVNRESIYQRFAAVSREISPDQPSQVNLVGD
jgi:hypothetical protein